MTKFKTFAALSLSLPLLLASPTAAQDGRTVSTGGLNVTLPDSVSKADLGKRDVRVLAVQVMLDRSRHSPGVIDGYMGSNTRRAIRYFRKANGLPAGDGIDKELINALIEGQTGDVFRSYTISDADVEGPFRDIPSSMEAKAKLDRLGYETPREMLAEKFHMDAGFLAALNPDADFGKAGTEITIISHGDEKLGAEIARIEVRKNEGTVAALDEKGNLVASYPATIGSDEFPSPSGDLVVKAIAPEPAYYFDPEGRKWGPDEKLKIAPGPNNPIGGTWIDLSKEGYGIHGSPDPALVSKRASHGCVRLTNWDAEELEKTVTADTPVVFVSS